MIKTFTVHFRTKLYGIGAGLGRDKSGNFEDKIYVKNNFKII